MAITAAQLIAEVKVAGAAAARGELLGVGESADRAGGMLKGALIGAALGAGVALVGIGVASVKAAGDFQQAMLSLVAHAGLAKDQIGNVSQAILKMSTDVGRAPTDLAEAMYPILSAFSGITDQTAKSKLALDTLKMSFQAVAGTTVNGTAVAQAAVGTFNALGLATNNAGTNATRMKGLFDQMDLTVQLGNMTWDTYKTTITKLAVSLQGTGVNFKEASAALATLTNEGYSARLAGTYLANLFTDIGIKTDAMATHAKKAGVAFNEQAFSGMDLAHKIEYLNQVTDGNKQKLLAVLGNNATALKAFDALSTGVGAYTSNLNSLNHSQGALATSFDTASQGFNFQMSRLKALGESWMVSIGTQMLPLLSKLINWVISVGIPGLEKFGNWFMNVAVPAMRPFVTMIMTNLWPALQQIWQFLVTVFTPVWQQLVDTFNTQLKPAWDQFIAALGPAMPALQLIGEVIGVILIAAIIGLAEVIALLAKGAIMAFGLVVQAISLLVTSFLNMLTRITENVHQIISIWNAIPNWWNNLIRTAEVWGENFINNFLHGLVSTWQNVVNWVNGALAWIAGLFPHSPVEHGPLKGIENWGKNITSALAAGIAAGMPGVQGAFGTLALPGVSGGATSFAGGSSPMISGLAASYSAASSGTGTQQIMVFLDRDLIGQVTGKYQAKQLRVQTGYRGVV